MRLDESTAEFQARLFLLVGTIIVILFSSVI